MKNVIDKTSEIQSNFLKKLCAFLCRKLPRQYSFYGLKDHLYLYYYIFYYPETFSKIILFLFVYFGNNNVGSLR